MTKIYILLITVILYLAWAYLYHRKGKSLTLTSFLEYLLTAVLALIILAGLLI